MGRRAGKTCHLAEKATCPVTILGRTTGGIPCGFTIITLFLAVTAAQENGEHKMVSTEISAQDCPSKERGTNP